MGVDEQAVVDTNGKVYETEGLRIADSSIMPSLASGPILAPSIMIGEKISDLAAGNTPLEPLRREAQIALERVPSG